MAVGRPIKLTPNVASKTVSIVATAGQTTFTPTGGYRIGDLAVYRNGVRLVQGYDYTAVDGANVVLQSGATVDDILDFQIFDNFDIADAIGSNGDQTIGGTLTVSSVDVSGIATIGTPGTSGVEISSSGVWVTGISTLGRAEANDVNVTGVVTASSFEGSGANLTGVSGFATALSTDQSSVLNKIFVTPQILEVGAGTSVQVDSNATSGYIAFTREARIDVGTGATFAIGSGTTFITNVLDIF
tara:strand:- start:257 stop:985 length:729 start_codon:yes stop_codon:yes gene_type:complete